MPQCVSTRNVRSTDQCLAPALIGHTMCGTHRKAKVPRLWVDVNQNRRQPAVKIQSVFRAWRIRKYLALCGPGVLARKECVNDEDVVTCVEKGKQDPFDYFGMEEAGKVWWFDFATIWNWSIRSIEPLNPYTNVPLDHEVKQRIKRMWIARRRLGMSMPSEAGIPTSDRIFRRWTSLCQIFRFYGFEDVHPNMFVDLTKQNLLVMFRLLSVDLDDMPKKPYRAIGFCTRGIQNANSIPPNAYIMTSLNALLFMLSGANSYDFVFLVLSALYRC